MENSHSENSIAPTCMKNKIYTSSLVHSQMSTQSKCFSHYNISDGRLNSKRQKSTLRTSIPLTILLNHASCLASGCPEDLLENIPIEVVTQIRTQEAGGREAGKLAVLSAPPGTEAPENQRGPPHHGDSRTFYKSFP